MMKLIRMAENFGSTNICINLVSVYKKKLLEHIQEHDVGCETVKNIRILLIGPIRSGKSSFLNTVASIDKGRPIMVTVVGPRVVARGERTSCSKKLKVFRPRMRLKNFQLLETMGLDECGLKIKDCLLVVNRNVRPNYLFDPVNTRKHMVHCIVFVMDANMVGQDNISLETIKKVKDLQDELKNIGHPSSCFGDTSKLHRKKLF
ncbi:interferon-induced protein 44-like [Mercenaria mercenaria]|uniref:interferon-induced protein 44-like n=1 Tax=Mercenaria mercenaria TaxID=6596 RepID=UPI00234F547B|nr:interferon-induced protein 44-like [Mercenaria mercenaria]